MKIVTGAAGFIGSCLVSKLNEEDIEDLVLVDDFSNEQKLPNLNGKYYQERIDRGLFEKWFLKNASEIDVVFHIGARTDTTEFDKKIFDELNVAYSKMIWNICAENNIPLIYASSAATYGLGEFGYDDDHSKIEKLKPLNPYGESKNEFDKWVLGQSKTPPNWYGLKFFNVYGPNEYHKGRMASVILHAFNQISSSGEMKLFRSHKPEFKDGEQLRDFIYVKDVVEVILFLYRNHPASGIYNLGTGKARSFLDLAHATFKAMNKEEKNSFIDTPADIRNKYQYFTEANMHKLRDAGYKNDFTSLEEGVGDYVKNYLDKKEFL
ncbi:MAG: ADP-glyceromanno-heptose 6-epimerase [Bacteroidetes bacterium]|nr:ADP-glyceromanno-heptose 6-epimerase [Bacteroidota bacterium]